MLRRATRPSWGAPDVLHLAKLERAAAAERAARHRISGPAGSVTPSEGSGVGKVTFWALACAKLRKLGLGASASFVPKQVGIVYIGIGVISAHHAGLESYLMRVYCAKSTLNRFWDYLEEQRSAESRS
jgi:hypothetical protein